MGLSLLYLVLSIKTLSNDVWTSYVKQGQVKTFERGGMGVTFSRFAKMLWPYYGDGSKEHDFVLVQTI